MHLRHFIASAALAAALCIAALLSARLGPPYAGPGCSVFPSHHAAPFIAPASRDGFGHLEVVHVPIPGRADVPRPADTNRRHGYWFAGTVAFMPLLALLASGYMTNTLLQVAAAFLGIWGR
jgi:hypothetical protein